MIFGQMELSRADGRTILVEVSPMSKLVQDLRYASRQLLNHPGFTAVAVLTLALGIAINASIFSVVSAVLLRKPPIYDPDRVMTVLSTNRAQGSNENPGALVSALDFTTWRDGTKSFAEMAALQAGQSFNLSGGGTPEHVAGISTSANYFDLLGVSAAMGRTFLAQDGQPTSGHIVVISHEFWQNHFAGSPQVLGMTVRLNDEPYTIVGVMPEKFKLVGFSGDIWVPLVFTSGQLAESARGQRFLHVFARLKPGVSREAAQAEISHIAANLAYSHPQTNKDWGAKLLSLQEFQILDGHVGPALTILMGVVGFVLLLACANIAGLLFGRGTARQRELAIRMALGADRLRLFRQLLSESLLIAGLGAVLGIILTFVGIRLLHAALDIGDYTRSWELRIDLPVLLFILTVSLATTLLFGFLPALRFSKTAPAADLKVAGRTGSVGRSMSWSWKALVSGEVALALLLLTAAGLMAKSFIDEMNTNPGFNPKNLVAVTVNLPPSNYPDVAKQQAFFTATVQNIRRVPGVDSAAIAGSLPLAAEAGNVPITVEGQSLFAKANSAAPVAKAKSYIVGPGYWQTMQIPLIRGRVFADSDTSDMPRVAVVNLAFANHFFANGDAIGRRFNVQAGDQEQPVWLNIVGIVEDVKDWVGQPTDDPQIYRPFLQSTQNEMTFVIRTRAQATDIASAVRAAISSIDQDQALTRVMTMSQLIDEGGAAGDRVMGQLLGIFAALALILAAVGIYGIVAFLVTQRTQEIGIRLAVGATRRNILVLLLSDGLKLAAIGAVPAIVVALMLPRLFTSMFNGFHVNPASTWIAAPVVLLLTTIAATYFPAYRATKLDPLSALRRE
jgi:predicted permease